MEAIIEKIQQHLSMLDLALSSSQRIASFARTEDLDGVINETDNRERLVNIITKLQQAIEEQINQLNAAEVTHEEIGILKAWFQDLTIWSERMIEFDKETVEVLSQQKENTTKEIAHIFKNKEMFKGYNHISKK